ncbi:MAG: hypothetical protein NZZ41_01240 [Candidatus Dojkabacteria bacterium]|nr:hypothetical protein [Candidatus Dojkabacteria bacterium]
MYSYVYYDKFQTNKILCWEYENGIKKLNVYDPPLYFFISSQDRNSEYKTIFGNLVKKIECKDWYTYKDKIQYYKSKNIETYESDVPIETKFIIQHYLGIDLKLPIFDIYFLDIEVYSDAGFPEAKDANYPIKIITIWSTKQKKFFIFCEKDFDDKFLRKNNENFEKYIHEDEKELLNEFMNFIQKTHPDVISGWNSNGYDIPYIINRCRKLFGYEQNEKGRIIKDGASKISPIDYVYSRRLPISEYKFEERFEIPGINLLDYMEVFQNYTFSEQESWKLDYIAKKEIGESKIPYDGTIADLYKNWQQYVEYNIQDVRLLKKLDEKKKFFNLLFTFCYGCRVPFEHFVKTTKVLDGAFLSRLAQDKIVLPDVRNFSDVNEKEDEKYIGGYVKDPEPGIHQWIVSFDATSLYPSIMMGWNISPETKITVIPKQYVKPLMKCLADDQHQDDTVMQISGKEISIRKFADFMKKNKYCLAANGAIYKTDVQGVVGKFVKEWFDKRKEYKKLMLKAKEQHNKEKEEEYDGLQYNYKILINSVYGYLGTPHSRLYDYDNAVAVTMTGRLITTSSIYAINSYFSSSKWENNKQFGNNKNQIVSDVVIYGDTDSLYVSFEKILKSMGFDLSKSDEKIKNFLLFNIEKENSEFFDLWSKEEKEKQEEQASSLINLVSSIIQKNMQILTTQYCNLQKNTIFFKREAIASRALFLNAKKHYAMWVINSEGVELEEGKRLKLVGIDVVRSSTPPFARENLKTIIKNILLKTNYQFTIQELYNLYEKFKNADIVDIAFPSSVNNLDEYLEKYKNHGGFKSTPMHIRAAILYNNAISKNKLLTKKYEPIKSGDKMKYVYIIENPQWPENVIGFKDKFPKELNLEKYVNKEEQFNRAVLSPIKSIFNVLNWKLPDLKYNSISEGDLFS